MKIERKNHKFLNLIVMIEISIFVIFGIFGILNFSYATETDFRDSGILIADSIYGGDSDTKVEKDYVPEDKDDPDHDKANAPLWSITNRNTFFREVRKNVAKWYLIIRYFAIATMLLILIVLLIKLAIATLGEKKALYKRMLLDWVVCFILVYFSHYFMIFIHFLNDRIIELVRNASLDLYTDGEYSLYETVRSRAYDFKFTVGFSGMYMYMALVYITCKYIILYAKRFILIVILTLLAPIMILIYSIQKIIYGKSKTLTKWMEEYAVNVLIQSVHAITYAIFVGGALRVSQNSFVGAILSLVFLNFMSKADPLFRKIFKFSQGSSMAEELSKSDPKEIKDAAINAYGFFKTAQATGLGRLEKEKYAKIGRLGIAAASKIKNTDLVSNKLDQWNERSEDKHNDKLDAFRADITGKTDVLKHQLEELKDFYETRPEGNPLDDERKEALDKAIATGDSKKVREELKKFQEYYDANSDSIPEEKYEKLAQAIIQANNDKVSAEGKRSGYLERRAMFKRIKNVLDPDTYVIKEDTGRTYIDEDGNEKPIINTRVIKPKKYYNAETDSYEYKGGVWDKFKTKGDEALNLSKADKAAIKVAKDMLKNEVLGIGGVILGMGVFVDNPVLGFPLLAKGHSMYFKNHFSKKQGVITDRRLGRAIKKIKKEQNKKYVKVHFSTGSILNMDRVLRDYARTDINVDLINHYLSTLENGSRKSMIPISLALRFTGNKGLAVNMTRAVRDYAEAYQNDLKDYELSVNIELMKNLKKDAIAQYKKSLTTIVNNIENKNISRLIEEHMINNNFAFATSTGKMIQFEAPTEATVSKQGRYIIALRDTALALKIYDLDQIDLNDKLVRAVLLQNLRKQGILNGEASATGVLSKKLIENPDGIQGVIDTLKATDSDYLMKQLYNQKVIEYMQSATYAEGDHSQYLLTHKDRAIIDKNFMKELNKANTNVGISTAMVTLAAQATTSIEDLSLDQVLSMVGDIDRSSMIKMNIAVNNVATGKATIAQPSQGSATVINSADGTSINEVPNADIIISYFMKTANDHQNVTTVDEVIQVLENDKHFKKVIGNDVSAKDAITNAFKAKQQEVNAKVNNIVIPILVSKGITDFSNVDLSDNQNTSTKFEIINALRKAGFENNPNDLVDIAQMSVGKAKTEDIENAVVKDTLQTYVETHLDGDYSRLEELSSAEIRVIQEEIYNKLHKTDADASQNTDVNNVVNKIKYKNQNNQQNDSTSGDFVDTNVDGNDEEQEYADVPLPIVKNYYILNDSVAYYFDKPQGVSDDVTIEVGKKSADSPNCSWSRGDSIIVGEGEVACARLVLNGLGGHELTIKNYTPADKILNMIQESTNSQKVAGIGDQVIGNMKTYDPTDSVDTKFGADVSSLAEDEVFEAEFKELQEIAAANEASDIIKQIRGLKFDIKKPEEATEFNKKVKEISDSAVDKLIGPQYSHDTSDEIQSERDSLSSSVDELCKSLLMFKAIEQDNEAMKIKKFAKRKKEASTQKRALNDGLDDTDVSFIINEIRNNGV